MCQLFADLFFNGAVESPRLLKMVRELQVKNYRNMILNLDTKKISNEGFSDIIFREWNELMTAQCRNWSWRDPGLDVDIDLELDAKRKFILFANTLTDAPLSDEMLFLSYYHWLVESIDHAANSLDYQLVIKSHPFGSSYDPHCVMLELENKYRWAKNIKFIADPISNLSIMEQFDAGITVRGTRGIEMLSYGFPMIFAGESVAGDLGLGINPKSKAEYFSILSSDPLPQSPTPYQRDIARGFLLYSNAWAAVKTDLIPSFGIHGANEFIEKIEGNLHLIDFDSDKLALLIKENVLAGNI